MADAGEMSKSAKKRAAKKARDSAFAAESEAKEAEAAAAAALQAPAKAKNKAKAEPAPAAAAPAAPAAPAGKAKAKGKAEPAPAAPAAKGKAKAEPKAAPKAEPAPAAAAAPAAPAPKKKKAPKAEPAPEQPAVKKLIETDYVNYELDDGSGPAWETLPTKKEKRKPKAEEEEAAKEEAPAASPTKKEKKAEKAKEAPKDEEKKDWGNESWEGWNNGSWDKKDWGNGDWGNKEWKGNSSWKDAKSTEAAEKAKAEVAAILSMPYNPELDKNRKRPNKKGGASPKEGEEAAAEGEKEKEEEEPEDDVPKVTVTVKVPQEKIGACIGPKGATVSMVQKKAGVKIDTNGTSFVITGPEENVPKAEKAIKELASHGYCSLNYENFAEAEIKVHPSSFPDIIGKQGCVISKIKDSLNLIIKTEDAPRAEGKGKDGKDGKGKAQESAAKGKVLLAGSAKDVEKAKGVINNIVMYGHDELTHPGQTHEEMDVEDDLHKVIIGRSGSELRHIQNNWKVRVAIPRKYSENQKVVITGEPKQVEQAKAYIDKLIVGAEKKGQQKEGDDPRGDDEVDPVAAGYIVKR